MMQGVVQNIENMVTIALNEWEYHLKRTNSKSSCICAHQCSNDNVAPITAALRHTWHIRFSVFFLFFVCIQ